MAYGRGNRIERRTTRELTIDRPWGYPKPGNTHWMKKAKARRERRRAKSDPECAPEYRAYSGYQW